MMILLFGIVFSFNASALTIYSSSCPDTSITRELVTKNGGELFKFTYCVTGDCRTLGNQEWYSDSDLSGQRIWEYVKKYSNVVVCAASGVCALGSAFIAGTVMPPAGFLAAALAGVSGTYGVKAGRRDDDIDRINQVRRDEDVDLKISCEEFQDQVLTLEDVLNRI